MSKLLKRFTVYSVRLRNGEWHTRAYGPIDGDEIKGPKPPTRLTKDFLMNVMAKNKQDAEIFAVNYVPEPKERTGYTGVGFGNPQG